MHYLDGNLPVKTKCLEANLVQTQMLLKSCREVEIRCKEKGQEGYRGIRSDTLSRGSPSRGLSKDKTDQNN